MEARNRESPTPSVFILGIEGAQIFYLATENRIFSTLMSPRSEASSDGKTLGAKKEKTARKDV
jgi:hypothetical protein